MTDDSSRRRTDPAAPLRAELDDAQALVARLEAENVSAVQEEESALERADTDSIVAARGRASAVADALERQRQKVKGVETQLAAVEKTEGQKAAKRRIARLTTSMAQGRAQYESEIARMVVRLQKDARRLFDLREGYMALLRMAQGEMQGLGVPFHPSGVAQSYAAWRNAVEALLEELAGMGADVIHLTFSGHTTPNYGWEQRKMPGPLGGILEQLVGDLAYNQAVAQSIADREAERQEATSAA